MVREMASRPCVRTARRRAGRLQSGLHVRRRQPRSRAEVRHGRLRRASQRAVASTHLATVATLLGLVAARGRVGTRARGRMQRRRESAADGARAFPTRASPDATSRARRSPRRGAAPSELGLATSSSCRRTCRRCATAASRSTTSSRTACIRGCPLPCAMRCSRSRRTGCIATASCS